MRLNDLHTAPKDSDNTRAGGGRGAAQALGDMKMNCTPFSEDKTTMSRGVKVRYLFAEAQGILSIPGMRNADERLTPWAPLP